MIAINRLISGRCWCRSSPSSRLYPHSAMIARMPYLAKAPANSYANIQINIHIHIHMHMHMHMHMLIHSEDCIQ